MKILTTLLIALFLLVVPHMSYGSGQLKYRIQCGLSSDTDLHQKLNAIPDLKTFTLPSGSKIYFSGGYFNKYTQAKKRLEEVHGAGFSDAFIRVFKYSNLLSRSVGDSYIEKVKIKIQVSLMRDTISTNSTAVKVNTSPKKIYSRAEIERIKEKAALRKAKEKRENGSSEPKIKERKIKVDEEEKENIVKEPPVFKIFLGKSNNGEEGKEFKQLKNETTFIGINSAEIKNHERNGNFLEVTVDFVSEIISCVKDKNSKIIAGDPEKVKKVYDTWKFSKNVKSNDPNWALIETNIN